MKDQTTTRTMALEELAKLLTPSEDPAQENGEKEKGTSAYKDLSRQFNEDDLDNPVAKKFLLNELDRLRKESVEGEEYHVKFHKEELKSAVLEEKLGSAQSTLPGLPRSVGLGPVCAPPQPPAPRHYRPPHISIWWTSRPRLAAKPAADANRWSLYFFSGSLFIGTFQRRFC